jgi:hypothetical protein
MSVSQQAAHTSELRETFKPIFEEETFHLACLKMDGVVERQIIRSVGLCFHSGAILTPLQKKAGCWRMQSSYGQKPISLSKKHQQKSERYE